MKKTGAVSLLIIVTLAITTVSNAQLRKDLYKSSDYLGNVVQDRSNEPGNWSNLFNMTMDHSYAMTFTSFGGQFQNLNAYTNTMHFFFSERMTGRLDLSLLHSPFGNSYMNPNGAGANVDFVIRNAELNYQLSERSNISIHFSEYPYNQNRGFFNTPFGYFGSRNY